MQSITTIVGDESLRNGLIPIALAYGGVGVCHASTTDQANRALAAHGVESCLLLLRADALGARTGRMTWRELLETHEGLAAVVIADEEPGPEVRSVCGGSHRILLENPFDGAAVVAAVRRAVSAPRPERPVAKPPLERDGVARSAVGHQEEERRLEQRS